ncbi:serine/threonine-protein kinase [Hyalangium sp.]|uniref:serine/threonine-protein kinase n=1 Tax=Hyalangium sp. TaxID=2028555 RepID=UPI002D727CEA|nr:serine/threonine-protein kinase [Hyalangium sp.]HYI02903.1 serine/threonine-protein kinase [Hyalangium sp.]
MPAQEPGELAFRAAGPIQAPLSSGLLGRLREEARREPALEPVAFLPVDARATEPVLGELPATASHAAAANVVARNLLTLWAAVARADSPMRPLAQCLEFLSEAGKVREAVRGDAAARFFDRALAGMALHCAATDRLTARGRRRMAGLLASSSVHELERGLSECAEAASHSPALARACVELVALGLHAPLAETISALSSSSLATARRLLEGIATAVALIGRERGAACRAAFLQALGADPQDSDAIEDFLEDAERHSRRSSRPEVPRLKSAQPLVTDLVAALGSRFWERGRGSASVPRLGVSVPKAAEKGLFLTPGARHVEVPILVRNGGDAAAGGISILVSRPAKGDSPIVSLPGELHIPWLSDQNLEDTSAVIIGCRLELDPDRVEQSHELRLALRSSWFGGAHDETYTLPLRFEEAFPASAEITGYSGEPLDLSDEKTFRVSSSSVRDCFKKLRERLHQGKAVRAVIFGRRRRGKSSICSSLERDPEVQKQFSIRHHVWNGTRMTTVATAFSTISELLVAALARSGVDVPRLEVADLSRAEELSQRFLYWFDTLADSIQERKRVLILLDEFQKWLAGLGSKQERLALLSALRHFNDRGGKLEVSFVLSGLQSLKGLVQESTDLANAVEFFEVRELTQEETDRYLRERVPLELDGRTRRRLYSMSGGNPYVLNRLSGGLLELLRHQRRTWCTAADVDALLLDDEAQMGRLAEFVRYMLHEDEDDGAATLRQLTVLRAVAALLQERGDFDGYVRLTDVEAWLQRHGVAFEPDEPRRQLDELTQTGLLQAREGGRYFLRGEWLCRQLAALEPGKVQLQPVTSRSNPDLVLGRYRKKQQLGQGGEAGIWLAENVQEGGHDVVLRIYPLGTVGLHQRIERERNLLSRIRHPNVVGFLGASIDEWHGGVVVLDYVHGHTLARLLEAEPAAAQPLLPGGELTVQVQLLKKIAGAVEACHAEGVVHKDLSPGNIMVAQELGIWEPTLIDFGLSGLDLQPPQGETTVLGTPGYIAPEKVLGGRRTLAADIYSLGSLFLRLLTGHDPSEAVISAERVSRLCEQAKVPPRLAGLLQQMLGQDPALRPSASEVHGSLETVLKPLSWQELQEQAGEAFVMDREDDAVNLFGQALSAVPGGERRGEPYERLLGEAADALERSNQPVAWAAQWLDKWILLARMAPEPLRSSQKLPLILAGYRARFRQEGARLIHQLATALAQPPSSPALVPLLREIARQDLFREPESATATFEALARYYAERLLEVGLLEDFGVACARHARVRHQQPLTAQLWLQRVRSLGTPARGDYEEELQALLESRRKTGRLQALPEARQQEPMKVGADERAHLVMMKLEEFDRRVLRLFPFIFRLERIAKDRHLRVSRPTLLRQDNIARHLPQGSQDPGIIIPLALDGSFTPEGIPLRVNIVLPAGTTPSQLDAAINVLKEAADLFDFL